MKDNKKIRVALVGNPNCGKTSLFNGLVGTHLKVGNWAGVTIEKYEGYLTYKGYKIKFIDLPGTYSLTAYSPEEVIARNYIIEENPDVVVDVVDGTNIERNLYLTTQLMELEANMVIAFNMYDEVKKQKIKTDFKQLEKLLGAHIVPTSAVKRTGLNSLLDHIIRVHTGNIKVAKNKLFFSQELEEKIGSIEKSLSSDNQLTAKYLPRWLAIKLLENDQLVYSTVKEKATWLKIQKELVETFAKYEKRPEGNLNMVLAEDRHAFIRGAVKETLEYPKVIKKTLTDHLDSVLINRVLGLPIFFAIMWLIFQFTFKLGEIPMGWLETIFGFLGMLFTKIIPAGLLQSVIVDGIIAGVGGVIVFLPNILLLFLAISFLEGTGYMARAAFVIDKILHKVGLHGKSFIPMITGFGCSVPAFMACRTLKSNADRITTMMIIPFMSCGAKLPVYILMISAFFSPAVAGNVLFGVYIFGIAVAIGSAKVLKTGLFKGESEPFVMELPPYRLPTFKTLFMQMWIKAYMYLRKAGTIILFASILIWAASNFPKNATGETVYAQKMHTIELSQQLTEVQKETQLLKAENQRLAEKLEHSFAGRIGKVIEPVIRPLGFDWRIGIGLVAGLAAKEIVVLTFETIYALGEVGEESSALAARLRNDPKYNKATALSLMVFVLLYMPCIAATTVFHKEAGAKKWTAIYIAYSMSAAWLFAFIVYQLGKLFLI
jgi:ferrous iron transport protein B